MNTRIIVVGVLLLVGIATALGFFWPFGQRADVLQLHGIVEIQEVRLASEVGGRVAKILVDEGATVHAGDVLVEFEAPELKAHKKELEAELRKAKLELKKLDESLPKDIEIARAKADGAKLKLAKVKEGWRKEEIDMTIKEFEVAKADLEHAKLEEKRARELKEKDSAAQGELDLAVAILKRAVSKHAAAEIKKDMVKKGGWEKDERLAEEEKKEAEANLKKLVATEYETKQQALEMINILDAKLEKLNVDLDETKVRAKEKCIVEVISVRAGDVVPPNQPVVRVLRDADMWVKVFVPETQLGKVPLNGIVEVRIDSFPDKNFVGKVIQVGTMAEFTPRNVQSKDERRFQVFPVKIRVGDPQGVFKAGMAAEVLVTAATP